MSEHDKVEGQLTVGLGYGRQVQRTYASLTRTGSVLQGELGTRSGFSTHAIHRLGQGRSGLTPRSRLSKSAYKQSQTR